MPHKLRLFISSPGDVGLERRFALGVIERLQGEFGGRLQLEPIRWEDQPFRATDTFQPQIIPPSETDIVVCVLWSRLGTALPEQFRREDGSRYSSGTEWEFEDAVRGFQERGRPDLLVYRRTQDPPSSLTDPQYEQRKAQYTALEAFCRKWFFSDDGAFKAAFKTFEAPSDFEQMLENDLRQLLLERLPEHLAEQLASQDTAIRWHKGSPYRGLAAFDVEHAPVFFGRTKAISDIKDILARRADRGCPFLLVFGMSGCGKSSLLRAGVLATMTSPGVVEGVDFWRCCVFRPSDAAEDLCHGLAASLASDEALPELAAGGVTTEALAAMLEDAPQHAAAPLGMALRRAAEQADTDTGFDRESAPRMILLVDQLEEIFSLDQFDDAARATFIRALAALARSGLIWVVATMRSDYYPRCAELPELVELKEGDGQYDLLPPTFDEVGQMIVYPTRAAGLKFEKHIESGRRLDAVIHEAAARDPQALPLLSFTLDELYRRKTDDGFLTFAAYEELGGLEGALAQRAEEVYCQQPAEVQETLAPLMRGLVTVDAGDDQLFAARRVSLEGLATTENRRRMLDALIDNRLFVTDRADDGTAVVRVAHEALLTHWPRVTGWLEEDREFLHIRSRLAEHADRWRDEGRRDDLLLPPGKPLAEAEEALRGRGGELDPLIVEYVASSLRLRRRRRIMQLAGAAALAAVLTAAGFVSYDVWQDAQAKSALADRKARAAAKETEKSLAQQKFNKRETLALDFKKAMANARAEMMNPLPTSRATAVKQYAEAFRLVTQLADTDDAEERVKWQVETAKVLLAKADAHGRAGDAAAAAEMLARREKLIAALPPDETGKPRVEVAQESEFGEHRITVMALQAELAAANLHLIQVLQNQKDQGGSFGQFAVIGPGKTETDKSASPEPKKSSYQLSEEEQRKLAAPLYVEGELLKQLELVVRSSARLRVRKTAVALAWAIATTYRDVHRDRAAAQTFFQKALDLILPPFQEAVEKRRQRGSIGAALGVDADGRLVVQGVVSGLPAEAAGLQVGDQILRIAQGEDGELTSLDGQPLFQAITQTRGKPGTTVRLELIPAGGREQRVVSIVRAEPEIQLDEDESEVANQVVRAHFTLGLLKFADDVAAARRSFEAAIEAQKYIPPQYRDHELEQLVYTARQNLAVCIHRGGDDEAACQTLKSALDDATAADLRLAAESTRRVVDLRRRAAVRLAAYGNVAAGRAEFLAALDLQRRMAAVSDDAEERRRLAGLETAFAEFLKKHGEASEAVDQFGAAARRYAELLAAGDDRSLLDEMTAAYTQAAAVAKEANQPEQAEQVEKLQDELIGRIDGWTTNAVQSGSPARAAAAAAAAARWFAKQKDKQRALANFRQAVQHLAGRSPNGADAARRLADDLYYFSVHIEKLDELETADDAMRRCVEIAAGQLTDPPHLEFFAKVLHRAGYVKLMRGDKQAALADYRRVMEIEIPKAEVGIAHRAGPKIYSYYETVTNRLKQIGDADALRAMYERRLALAEQIHEATPERANRSRVAESHQALGEFHQQQQSPADARSHFDKAAEIYRELLAGEQEPKMFQSLAAALYGSIVAAETLGDDEQSLADRRSELKSQLDQSLTRANDAGNQTLLWKAHRDAAPWYAKIGHNQQAIDSYFKAVELREKQLRTAEESLRPLLFDYYNLSYDLQQLGDLVAADRALERCRQLADSLLTESWDERLQLLVYVRSAAIKHRLNEPDAVREFAAAALQVRLPLDDDEFVRKTGKSLLAGLSEVTRRLLDMKHEPGIRAGYEARIQLARRLAEVVDDAASWRGLAEIYGYQGDWRRDSENLEAAAESFTNMIAAAETLVAKANSPESRSLLADAREKLNAVLTSDQK